jgi:hypothetical protein
LVQAFLKKWWVESDFKAPNLPLSLRFKQTSLYQNVSQRAIQLKLDKTNIVQFNCFNKYFLIFMSENNQIIGKKLMINSATFYCQFEVPVPRGIISYHLISRKKKKKLINGL